MGEANLGPSMNGDHNIGNKEAKKGPWTIVQKIKRTRKDKQYATNEAQSLKVNAKMKNMGFMFMALNVEGNNEDKKEKWKGNMEEKDVTKDQNMHEDSNVNENDNRRTQKETMGKQHVAQKFEVTKRKKGKTDVAKILDIASHDIIKEKVKGITRGKTKLNLERIMEDKGVREIISGLIVEVGQGKQISI